MSSPGYELRTACWRRGQIVAERVDEGSSPEGAVLTWTHVVSLDVAASTSFLIDRYGFSELEVEDALSEGERPHLHENGDHLFFTVPAVRVEDSKLHFAEIGFFLGKDRLVTVSTVTVERLHSMFDRACGKQGERNPSASRLAYLLLDAIVDDYYPAMDMLEDKAEALEDLVFGGRPVPIKDLLRVKRRLLEVRRRLTPVRDILNGLLRHDIIFVAKHDRPYYQDIYDHVLRVLEHVDLNRDIVASVLDANLATVSNRLNETMKILTVASVILMSAALVAGVYGMNFKHMPELDWMWGYPFAIGLMLVIGLVQLWVFRRKKML